MNPVAKAIEALASGGAFEDVLTAAKSFSFAPLPQITSLAELGEEWEYREVPDSFRDTVEVAYFEGKLTREQVAELRAVARGGQGNLGK